MSSTVSCNDDDKAWFEEFQEPDEKQAEAFSRLVENAKAYNGELIDESKVAEETAEKMSPKLELVMYRVIDEVGDE